MSRYDYFILGIFILSPNVLTTFGIDLKIYYLFIILLSFILIVINNNTFFQKSIILKVIVILCCCLCLWKLQTDHSPGMKILSLNVMGMGVVFSCLPYAPLKKNKDRYLQFLLVFYIVLCVLSILERVFTQHLFTFNVDAEEFGFIYYGDSMFRSFGLIGHPLQNALVVSTIMSFILISKIRYKYWLWLLGYVAILCFNTRSSIFGNAALLIVYSLYENLSKKGSPKIFLFATFFIVMTYISIYYIGLGGRLLQYGLIDEDGSAGVRIKIWSIFSYYGISDFLFGYNFDKIQLMLYSSGLRLTENFWLDYTFRYGFIAVILLTILYSLFIHELSRGFSKFDICFTSATFLLLASTNNSLSCSWLPMYYFFYCYWVFRPQKANISNLPLLRSKLRRSYVDVGSIIRKCKSIN